MGRVGRDSRRTHADGRIPVSDVEFDESTGFRIRTVGIERLATTN